MNGGANIEIDKGASLRLSAPDVSWVKLHSVGPNYATVKAFGGALAINGICISSWDDTKQQVDTNPADGRSFLLARDGGQMTVDKSQLAYLGFGDRESYGLSWTTTASPASASPRPGRTTPCATTTSAVTSRTACGS